MSGAVFLFEREATAPRSEIRKQAVSPAADAIKTSCLYGGFFNSPLWRGAEGGVVYYNLYTARTRKYCKKKTRAKIFLNLTF